MLTFRFEVIGCKHLIDYKRAWDICFFDPFRRRCLAIPTGRRLDRIESHAFLVNTIWIHMLDQEEINRITYACSIRNHPVSKLSMKARQNHLQGLRAVLPMSSSFMDVLFKAWEISILGAGKAQTYDFSNPKEKVKTAIKLNRTGWRLIRLAYPFFFDCFYLTSVCNKIDSVDAIYEQLAVYCNLFTRKALQRVHEYFKDGTPCNRIPVELVNHRDVNLKFASAPLKRILVVANVSAGKSTLINALVGKKINRSSKNACTNELCQVFSKPLPDAVTIKTRNEGKYKYIDLFDKWLSDVGERIGVFFPSGSLQGKKICFLDTPGYNDANNIKHRNVTETAIKRNDYDAVLYVASADNMGTDDEKCLMEFIVKSTTKPIIFVMNKLDNFIPANDSIRDSISSYRSDIMKLGIINPVIVPISAYVALLARLEKQRMLDKYEQFYLSLNKDKFIDDYYNFPKYIQDYTRPNTNDLLIRSGITVLENVLVRL